MDKGYASIVQLNKLGVDDGKEVSYDWVLSTRQRNYYAYAMSLEVLKSFRKGLNAKPVRLLADHIHRINNILGRVEGARIRAESELIGKVIIQRDLDDVNSNAIIERINAGNLTDGSVGFDWNDAYFKCDLCGSRMIMNHGFVYDENNHFLGERDKDGKLVTAVLYGNPTVNEFSLVTVHADPGAEKANDLYKIMSDNNLGIGALQVASELQNLHFGNLCQTLGIHDPNRPIQQPKRPEFHMPVLHIGRERDREQMR